MVVLPETIELLVGEVKALLLTKIGLSRLYLAPLYSFLQSNKSVRTVLFICKGNICRSPYAEERFRGMLFAREIKNIEVRSVGTETTPGKCANPEALAAAKLRGIDLSAHRTEQLNEEILAAADLVVVMDQCNYRQIKQLDSKATKKVLFLGALQLRDKSSVNIADPYAMSPEVFSRCYEEIDCNLTKLTDAISGGSK